jgi:hypothetical protein
MDLRRQPNAVPVELTPVTTHADNVCRDKFSPSFYLHFDFFWEQDLTPVSVPLSN